MAGGDFLLRDDSPLHIGEWSEIDRVIRTVMTRELVGRRFLMLYGPLGAAVQVVPTNRYAGYDIGQVNMTGEVDDPVSLADRLYQRIPMLHKDFILFWRDIETSRSTGMPMDWSVAMAAASFVAQAEDHLIFHGSEEPRQEGLLTVEGRHVLDTEGWEEGGSGYRDIVRAIEHLTGSGFTRPFSVVVGIEGYAQWHRLFGHSGVLEVDQIRKLADGGVFVSPMIPSKTTLVLASGSENMDVAIGLDATAAFLESTAMNHVFRVLETLTLRIKRPSAVCHLTANVGGG